MCNVVTDGPKEFHMNCRFKSIRPFFLDRHDPARGKNHLPASAMSAGQDRSNYNAFFADSRISDFAILDGIDLKNLRPFDRWPAGSIDERRAALRDIK